MSESHGSGQEFRLAAEIVLDYLREQAPMGVWSITRVENERQTHLMLGENTYDLKPGDGAPWEDSFCIHMVAGESPRVAPDAKQVPAYAAADVNSVLDIGAYAGAPIKDSDGSLFGVNCGLDPEAKEALDELNPSLQAMGALLEVALSADRIHRKLRAQLGEARQAAMSDALTGLGNRRAWDQWLATLEEDFHDFADPTVVVMVDLNNFKAINDGPGGHPAGDEVLKAAATSLSTSARPGDRVARIGGDEFGMLLADCSEAQAPAAVDRFVAELARVGIEASAGWARLRVGEDVRTAVRRADEAMFAVKRGRE